jgi:hypothetical protein
MQQISLLEVNIRNRNPFLLLLYPFHHQGPVASSSQRGLFRFTREVIVIWLMPMCLCLTAGLVVMSCIVCRLKRRLRGSHDLVRRILKKEFYRTDDH